MEPVKNILCGVKAIEQDMDKEAIDRLVEFAKAQSVLSKLETKWVINALSARPDALTAVKEWLAGQGYGVFFADSFKAKICMPGCLASAPLHGCKLGLHDKRDTMSPGDKCPAMLARKG